MLKTLVVLLAAHANPGPAVIGPPSDAQILQAMPKVTRGVPFVYEEFRDDIVIVKNRIAGLAVAIPLPAGTTLCLTTSHWECAVYYSERLQTIFPIPITLKKNRVQVLYLDHVGMAK